MGMPHLLDRAASLLDNRVVAALVSPRHIDDYLELVSPMLAQRETRARIVRITRESKDAVTLTLSPTRRFRGFTAGQYVPFTVEIDGRRVTRCFSFSSAPGGETVDVTIKARPGGLVSVWANERAKVSDVVTLGTPAGDFVLPEKRPHEVLLIAGGSGVTPIKSLVLSLLAEGYAGRITCLLYARSREDAIFGDALTALAATHANLTVHVVLTRGTPTGAVHGRFSDEHVRALAPGFANAEAYVCGPTPLTSTVRAFFAAHGRSHALHVERFTLDVIAPASDDTTHAITFTASQVTARGNTKLPLLAQAEQAGLSPDHGCRMGICHTCTCVLEQGAVKDLTTGELIAEPGQRIRICTTVPQSDIRIAL